MPDDSAAFCGCKDGTIYRWDLGSGSRTVIPSGRGGGSGHLRDVLSATISPDGRILMTGSRDQTVKLWDLRSLEVVKQLTGHRGPVTSVTVSRGDQTANELYSGSADRCNKVWDIEQRGYVETLYGHLEGVTALDSVIANEMLSASLDRTCRLWKVTEETQLLFQVRCTYAVSCTQVNIRVLITGATFPPPCRALH
jgi:ribosomal RNA-processing protein 9